MNLPLDFIDGTVRQSFVRREDAIAAAREAIAQDEKRRARVVWHCSGAESAGCVVPAMFLVGLASGRDPVGAVRVHVEGTERRRR